MPSYESKEISSYKQRRQLAVKYNNEGLRRYKNVDFDDAIDNFTKAIEIDQTLGVAYYNRGTVRYRLGIFSGALQDMKIAVHLTPDNMEFREGLEECQRIELLNRNKPT